MRPTALAGWLSLALALAATAARAEPYAAVVQAETEARCGPSLNPLFYATNKLHPGDKVEVRADRGDGWLEISPPDKSFSWIEKRFLKPDAGAIKPNAVVELSPNGGLEAPVLVGSEVVNEQPTKVGASLKEGAQVTPLGREITDEHGVQWVQIQPPAAEVRYVRADAVRRPAEAPGATAAGKPAAPPRVGSAAPAAGQMTEEDLKAAYLRTYQETEARDPQEAVAQYYKLAGLDPDPDRRQKALTRADYLRNTPHNPPAPDGSPAPSPAGGEGRVYPLPGEAAAPPSARLSPPAGVPPQGQPSVSASPSATGAMPAQPDGQKWYNSGPGKLRKSGARDEQGRPLFALDDLYGRPMYYIAPGSGVDLQPYLGRAVELSGPAEFNARLRANYMIAMRVQPAGDGR
jgi:hypothetical protein